MEITSLHVLTKPKLIRKIKKEKKKNETNLRRGFSSKVDLALSSRETAGISNMLVMTIMQE